MKKKNRKFIMILVVLLLLFILITILLFNRDKNKVLLDKIYNNVFKTLKEEQYKDINNVFISLYDEKNQAVVNIGHGSNAKKAFKEAISNSLKSIDKNYEIKIIKVDLVDTILPIEQAIGDYYVSDLYGLSLSEDFNIAFLNEELVLGNLWVNGDQTQTLSNINNYLIDNNMDAIVSMPDTYYAFKTKNLTYKDGILISSNLDLNPREENISADNVMKMMNGATDYLLKEQNDNGKFIYGHNAISDSIIGGYNIVRHCGTLIALAEQASLNKDKTGLRQVIQNGISYIENHTISNDNNESLYVYQSKSSSYIKLGSNALALLAITKYMEVYGTDEYMDLARSLANGIVNMQNSDTGEFIFLLSMSDLNPISSKRYAYYEGEATYALARYYGISKDEKYLNAAKCAVDYFIENDYAKYKEHWISYAVNELTKYIMENKYFDLGIKNYMNKKNIFIRLNQISQTDFELLMNTLELYNHFNEKYDEELLNIINKALVSRIQNYIFPEEAMYFVNPLKYQNTFCVKSDSYRIRIDDVQHSLSGVYLYYKNLDSIKYNTLSS